ncbi:hypothetical protein HID58_087398 [Brassica napus]|uniref:Uncharacterized protein n=1 Tax=Brassica napus TaxID=3708 RepID=A0ABQ7XV20_BRANA|nr:hypothetical protein HID58_087398 [Brassica napus]
MEMSATFYQLVRRAAALYHSRFQPDLPTEEGSETKRDRSKAHKDKHLMVVEDAVDGQLSPDNILKDYLDSQAGESNEVPDSSKAARMVNGGLLMINRALDTSKQEAHMARFKAEVADKEIARLKDELESSRRRERESFEKEVNHAYSQGKREVVKVMKSRRDKFSQKFGELKGRYKVLADYRECCGTVGGFRLFANLDWSSLSNDRAESVVDPARLFVELDWSSSMNDRAESVVDSAQPFAELDLVQLGERLS